MIFMDYENDNNELEASNADGEKLCEKSPTHEDEKLDFNDDENNHYSRVYIWKKEISPTMKKAIGVVICVVITLAIIFAVTFFSSKGDLPSKDDILFDIAEYEGFAEDNLNITSYEEVSRQTNYEAFYDKLVVHIVAENEFVIYEAIYNIDYELFNEGFELENIERAEKAEITAKSINMDDKMLEALKSFVSSEHSTLTEISVSDIKKLDLSVEDELNIEGIVNANGDNCKFEGTLKATYRLLRDGWSLVTSYCSLDGSFVPKTAPTDEMVIETIRKNYDYFDEIIVKNKEMKSADEYDYLCEATSDAGINQDIFSCSVSFIFTAEKGWEADALDCEFANSILKTEYLGTYVYNDDFDVEEFKRTHPNFISVGTQDVLVNIEYWDSDKVVYSGKITKKTYYNSGEVTTDLVINIPKTEAVPSCPGTVPEVKLEDSGQLNRRITLHKTDEKLYISSLSYASSVNFSGKRDLVKQ